MIFNRLFGQRKRMADKFAQIWLLETDVGQVNVPDLIACKDLIVSRI